MWQNLRRARTRVRRRENHGLAGVIEVVTNGERCSCFSGETVRGFTDATRPAFAKATARQAPSHHGYGEAGFLYGASMPCFFISRHIVVRLTCSSRAAAPISP
jgi:hypothetical protein